MRLVVDTNILVSALLATSSLPAQLVVLWRAGRFDLLTAAEQLDELMRVTRYPKIRARLAPAIAGRLVNDLRALAVTVETLPLVDVSPDPDDNYLLALAASGAADFLVTGDKRDLLGIAVYQGTKIGNHSFRATGITAYLKNGGTLENAAAMANHASTRTTQLYDRRHDDISLDEVERIRV